jgi:hypothetical protein
VLLSVKSLEIAASAATVSARDIAVWGGVVVAAGNGLAGVFGATRWYLHAPSREFWIAVRIGQALALAYAVVVGLLLLAHDHPSSNLFYLYALLPIAVGFIAEQLRIVAADQVLAARDLESSKQVARLAVAEQQAIVLAILRRELGVMTLAALVVCGLALRAAGTY